MAWNFLSFTDRSSNSRRESEREREREKENEYNISFVIRYLCPEMNLKEEGRIFPCMHCSTMVNCEKRGSRRASDAPNHFRSDETASPLCSRLICSWTKCDVSLNRVNASAADGDRAN